MKKHQQSQPNFPFVAGGLITLIGVLLLAVANNWGGLNSSNFWPAYILMTGLGLAGWAWGTASNVGRAILAYFATILTLLGLFFFKFTLGLFIWRDMAELWPVFILIPGIGLLVSYWISKFSPLVYMAAGLIVPSVLFLGLLQVDGWQQSVGKLWPVLIILVGLVVVFAGVGFKKK